MFSSIHLSLTLARLITKLTVERTLNNPNASLNVFNNRYASNLSSGRDLLEFVRKFNSDDNLHHKKIIQSLAPALREQTHALQIQLMVIVPLD